MEDTGEIHGYRRSDAGAAEKPTSDRFTDETERGEIEVKQKQGICIHHPGPGFHCFWNGRLENACPRLRGSRGSYL